MAQKRTQGDEMTGREKKKLKVSVARTIATQVGPSQSTLQSGPIPSNSAFFKYYIILTEILRHQTWQVCPAL